MRSHLPQRRFSPSAAFRLLSITCLLMSTTVLADTTTVDARAAGKFGAYAMTPDEDSLDLVEAHVFTAPGTIRIRAEGRIDLHPSYARVMGIGPEGLLWRRGGGGNYTPLEEATVDARGTGSMPATMQNNGALFGAFVPESTVNTPGFRAINKDFPDGGIPAGSLFLIGPGLEFTADEPGTLFVGVNDSRPSNNSGSFTVTISAH